MRIPEYFFQTLVSEILAIPHCDMLADSDMSPMTSLPGVCMEDGANHWGAGWRLPAERMQDVRQMVQRKSLEGIGVLKRRLS